MPIAFGADAAPHYTHAEHTEPQVYAIDPARTAVDGRLFNMRSPGAEIEMGRQFLPTIALDPVMAMEVRSQREALLTNDTNKGNDVLEFESQKIDKYGLQDVCDQDFAEKVQGAADGHVTTKAAVVEICNVQSVVYRKQENSGRAVLGLVALTQVGVGEVVGVYTGTYRSVEEEQDKEEEEEDEEEESAGNSKDALFEFHLRKFRQANGAESEDMYIDVDSNGANETSAINHFKGVGKVNCASLDVFVNGCLMVVIVTTAIIKRGHQFLLDYGSDFIIRTTSTDPKIKKEPGLEGAIGEGGAGGDGAADGSTKRMPAELANDGDPSEKSEVQQRRVLGSSSGETTGSSTKRMSNEHADSGGSSEKRTPSAAAPSKKRRMPEEERADGGACSGKQSTNVRGDASSASGEGAEQARPVSNQTGSMEGKQRKKKRTGRTAPVSAKDAVQVLNPSVPIPRELANDGGPSGQRRKKARTAFPSASNTSGEASTEMLDHSAPKKRRTTEKLCEHQRRRSQCKDCGGGSICEHKHVRSICKDCSGGSICEHKRVRSTCQDCGGGSLCEHQRRRSQCKDCGGSSLCEHQRQRSTCKDCGGGGLCEHQRVRSTCKDCGGGGLCEHQRRRSDCNDCREAKKESPSL